MEYYRILDVSPQASSQEIKLAYRHQARRCHPDANPPEGRIWAEAHMGRLNEAYAVLSDPVRRAGYDARPRQPDPKSEQPGLRFSWEPPFTQVPLHTRPAPFPTLSHLMGALTMLLGLVAVRMLLHPAAASGFASWLSGWFLAGLALFIGGSLALSIAVVVLTCLAQPDSASPALLFLTVFIVAVVMALVSALARWAGS